METKSKMKEILVKDGDIFPFVNMTDNYGRASFDVCPIWKYRKLVGMYIYPRQQKDIDYYYKVECCPKLRFHLSGYQQLDNPIVWDFWYCKEHKTQSFQMYAPNESNFLWFSFFSDNITIGFLKTILN